MPTGLPPQADAYDLLTLIHEGRIGPFRLGQTWDEVREITRAFDPGNTCWNESWFSGERLAAGWFELGELELMMEGSRVDDLKLRCVLFTPGKAFTSDEFDLFRTRFQAGGLRHGMPMTETLRLLSSLDVAYSPLRSIGEDTISYSLPDHGEAWFSADSASDEPATFELYHISVAIRPAMPPQADAHDLLTLIHEGRIGPFRLGQTWAEVREITRAFDPGDALWTLSMDGDGVAGGYFELGEIVLSLSGGSVDDLRVYYIKFMPGTKFWDDIDGNPLTLHRVRFAAGGIAQYAPLDDVRDRLHAMALSLGERRMDGDETMEFSISEHVTLSAVDWAEHGIRFDCFRATVPTKPRPSQATL